MVLVQVKESIPWVAYSEPHPQNSIQVLINNCRASDGEYQLFFLIKVHASFLANGYVGAVRMIKKNKVFVEVRT